MHVGVFVEQGVERGDVGLGEPFRVPQEQWAPVGQLAVRHPEFR